MTVQSNPPSLLFSPIPKESFSPWRRKSGECSNGRSVGCEAQASDAYSQARPADRRSPAINECISTEMMEHNPPKPRLILPRVAERRKTTYLNGPPFIDDEGLVLVDRRSNEDRRGKIRNKAETDRQVCALLRFRAKEPDDKK